MSIIVRVDSAVPGKSSGGVSKTFLKDEVTLGRLPENDIALSSPSVSGRHAKFVAKKDPNGVPVLFVLDVGSSNGTFLEEKRLVPKVDTQLGVGKRLLIGEFIVTAELLASEEKKPDSGKSETASAGRPTRKRLAGGDELFDQELQLKRRVHDKLIERLDLRRKDIAALSDEDLRTRAQSVVEQILVDLRWEIPVGLDRERVIKQILDEALALGPLEELLADDTCSEVMVNNFQQIYAEKGGRLTLTDLRFSSEQAVLAAIERILAPIGRRIDESSPLVDARLKDGSRVNAVIRPLALAGPCITIRKFSRDPLTVKDLVKYKSLSHGMAGFLELVVKNRLNVVISGGTGSGKTTLLNVISSFVPNEQRVITIEDAAELQLPQEHVVSFETRPPNLEGKGAITIRDLVKNSLRMRPDRIIVGECRGAETLDMLQAMNTGHDGSMTTGHANTPADMIRRMETMVLTAGLDLPVRAVREQIASAVNIIIQQTRFSEGTRKITAITEVVGMDLDEGTVMMQDVFVFRQDGYDENGRIRGTHQATGYVPKFFRQLQERGLPVDASVFQPGSSGE